MKKIILEIEDKSNFASALDVYKFLCDNEFRIPGFLHIANIKIISDELKIG